MPSVPDASKTWLFRPRATSVPRFRLFAFPYAGRGASVYRLWAEAFPQSVELCGVQLPGREERIREQPFTQMQPLIEALTQVMTPHLDLPYALFGHSFGALVSFELARHFRRLRLPAPVHLFVSGRRAPSIPSLEPFIHRLGEQAFMARVQALGGTPPALLQDPELRAFFIRILRADFSVIENYAYSEEEPLAIPMTALSGTRDREAPEHEMMPWQLETSAGFSLRRFEGDHFFVTGQSDAVTSLLRDTLVRSRAVVDERQDAGLVETVG
jgi:medium-chain acyl-[acyl-carrier-protein] hydrolase